MKLGEAILKAAHVRASSRVAVVRAWDALFRRGLEGRMLRGDVSDPRSQVGAVYVAMGWLMETLASVPWSIVRARKSDKEKVDRIPDHEAVVLLNTAPDLVGNMLMQVTCGWRESQGQAFWLLDKMAGGTKPGAKRRPGALRVLDARYVKAHAPNGKLQYWKYDNMHTHEKGDISPEEIARFWYWHHLDPFKGLAPLEAARLSYGMHWRGQKFQDQFYTHGGFPPFYISVPKDADLDTPEMERLNKTVTNRFFRGLATAFRPPVLFKGIELKSVAVNQRDMEWLGTHKATTWDVLNIFGVRPELVGYTEDANRAVSTEAKRAGYGGRIKGIGNHFEAVINASVIIPFWPDVRFQFEWQQFFATVMPEEMRAAVQSAKTLFDMLVPPSESFRVFDIPVDTSDKPWLDEGYATLALIPVTDLEELQMREPEPSKPQTDDDDEEGIEEEPKPTRSRRLPLWRVHERRMAYQERAMTVQWRRFQAWLRSETISNLRSSYQRAASEYVKRASADSYIPRAEVIHARAIKYMERLEKLALQEGWESVVDEVGAGASFSLQNPRVIELLSQRVHAVKHAGDTSAQMMRNTMEPLIEAGAPLDDIEDALAEMFRESYFRQARTVARTESGAAYNGARFESMAESGIEFHEWLSAHDVFVRDSHLIDGEVVRIGEAFSNGLSHPHDFGAPPEEVINCRCVTVVASERTWRKRHVRKSLPVAGA